MVDAVPKLSVTQQVHIVDIVEMHGGNIANSIYQKEELV